MLLFLLVVLRIAGLVRQVEEQAAQLAALAQRDGLTGMPNRRAWEGELPSHARQSTSYTNSRLARRHCRVPPVPCRSMKIGSLRVTVWSMPIVCGIASVFQSRSKVLSSWIRLLPAGRWTERAPRRRAGLSRQHAGELRS